MYRLKFREILASEIAEFIGSDLIGEDITVKKPTSISNLEKNSFTFIPEGFKPETGKIPSEVLFICKEGSMKNLKGSYIFSANPKLDFIRTVNEFFIEIDTFRIATSAKIHPEAHLARNVSIGENCVIGPDVSIGENTQVLNNVVICSHVRIGSNCIIKDNSTIGSEGYNFEDEGTGIPIHYPHFGTIVIGNHVWIGSNTSIESAAIENTIISDYVKIDDLVQIGSGSFLGDTCMITAGVIISRNVRIFENSIIAPNATILEGRTIGRNSIVGTGSVVIKDVEDQVVVAGNPAEIIRKNK